MRNRIRLVRRGASYLLGAVMLLSASTHSAQGAVPDYQFAGKIANKAVEMELTVSKTDNGITGRWRYTNPPSEWNDIKGETGMSLHPMGNMWMNVSLWPAGNPSATFDITINHWDSGEIDAEGTYTDGSDITLKSVKKTQKKATSTKKRKTAARKKTRR